MGIIYAAIDVETIGLYPTRGHRVIEIGVVLIRNGEFAEEFHTLINCGGDITCARGDEPMNQGARFDLDHCSPHTRG